MATTLGLTKLAEKGISKLKQKAEEKKQEIKEKVNPYSATNKRLRHERDVERQELRKTEQESYRKERRHQAEERGKHTAQREYGTYRPAGRPPARGRRTGRGMPMFVPAPDPFNLFGPTRKAKPKTPTKTTTVTTGNKTITIREKVPEEEQKKKRQPQYDFPDPFAGFL